MAKYRIQSPEGATYEITAPDDATPEQVQAYVQQNVGSLKPAAPAAPKGNADEGGIWGGIKQGLRDPIDAGAQLLVHALPSGLVRAGNRLNNKLADMGLPLARLEGPDDTTVTGLVTGQQGNAASPVDRLVKGQNAQYEADRAAAGRDGFDASRLFGNVANPVNFIPAGAAVKGAQTMGQIARAGATAGAIGGALQPVLNADSGDFWTAKGIQTGVGAASGAVLTPLLAKGAEAVAGGVRAVANRVRPAGVTIEGKFLNAATPEQLDVAVNRILQSQGQTARDMPSAVLDSVRAQIQDAVRQRTRLDPAAALRRAQAEAIGMTDDAALTSGQVLRDPMRFAQEKNLSGVRIDTPTGPTNPLADKFAAQNLALQGVFDQAGARGAVNPGEAGAPLMGALRGADAPVRANVDTLYETARGMTAGRAAELDRAHFNQAANEALDAGMWGRFLPAEARGFVNDIAEGKVPFTVESVTMIDSRLSELQRAASRQGNDAAASAIGVVRRQLHDVPFAPPAAEVRAPGVAEAARAAGVVDNGVTDVPFREVMPPGLPGQRALPAPPGRAVATAADFELPPGAQPGTALSTPAAQAQPRMSEGEAARQAFDEARKAARARFATIEDTPALKAAINEEAPDDFVRKYVINGKAEDLQNLRRVLENSPEALAQVRAQIAAHLKRAAFGDNLSGDAPFAAARYAAALRNIGPERLRAFFQPEEVMRFNLAAKVGSDLESIPAGARYAVNRSGSGAAVFNLLQGLTQLPGVGKVPGIGWARDQVGKAQSEAALRAAMRPGSAAMPAAQPGANLTPEQVSALRLLFAPPAVGAGAAAGSNF